AHGFRLETLREREAQSRIDESGRFPGARRPDDDVPRQVVEVEAPFLAARLFDHGDGFVEPALERLKLFGRSIGGRRGFHDLFYLLRLRAVGAVYALKMPMLPADDYQQNQDPASGKTRERPPVT